MASSESTSPVPSRRESINLRIDSRQVSRDAALRAAYWFTKELYIEFPPSESDRTFEAILRLKDSVPTLDNPNPRSLGDLASEFHNALIDAELRVRVQRETSAVRELLLAKAFAEAGVLESNPPGSFVDPVLASEMSTGESELVVISRNGPTDEPTKSR